MTKRPRRRKKVKAMEQGNKPPSATWSWIIAAAGSLASLAEKALIDLPVPTIEEREKFASAVIRLGRIVTGDVFGKK